jgi:polyphosphate kinase 2
MEMNLTEKDVKLLNSKKAIKSLLNSKRFNIAKALRYVKYEKELKKMQLELIKLQKWINKEQKKVVIIYEGRDAAGKGGAIRRTTEHINPREFRVVALPKPTAEERGQWYFQRYVNQLPKKGEIVFFDRSWYNRAIVEPVNDFCTDKEYNIFMNQVNDFERMMIEDGIILIKFYFSISKEEQQKRFDDIKKSTLKKWKYSKVDARAIELWDEYTKYKEVMYNTTNTEIAPWKIIDADKKMPARLEAIEHVLSVIPYKE